MLDRNRRVTYQSNGRATSTSESDYIYKKLQELDTRITNLVIPSSGGGGGETGDYNNLTNIPKLDSTSNTLMSGIIEDIKGTIKLHKISKTGSYNDLLDKPVITEQVQSDWSETNTSSKSYIKNKPASPSSPEKIELTGENQYWLSGNYALLTHNSDLVGINNFIFHDECGPNEGLYFPKENVSMSQNIEDYEILRGYRGKLYYGSMIIGKKQIIGGSIAKVTPNIVAWIVTPLSLNSSFYVKIGTELSLSSSGIVVPKGVKAIRIIANLQVQAAARVGDKYFGATVNNTPIGSTWNTNNTSFWDQVVFERTVTLNSTIENVVRPYFQGGFNGTIEINTGQFEVEVIEYE